MNEAKTCETMRNFAKTTFAKSKKFYPAQKTLCCESFRYFILSLLLIFLFLYFYKFFFLRYFSFVFSEIFAKQIIAKFREKNTIFPHFCDRSKCEKSRNFTQNLFFQGKKRKFRKTISPFLQ